jgi:hypothetical protein
MTLASNWTLDSGVTLSSDGDIGTLAGTTATNGASQTVVGSLSTTTYPKLFARAKSADGTTRTLDILVTYTSGSDTFTMTGLGSSWPNPFTFNLTTGKTISSVKFLNQSVSGSLLVDFVFPFKETLTLPTVIQPIGFRKQRNIVEIPIIQREGGQVQDLGSLTPEGSIAGGLVNTTSGQSGWTQTYTADQWWQILYGLTLETGTLQADGNPTWQWFQSDQIQGKYLPKAFLPQQVPGRVNYHNYALQLKQMDVGPETTANSLAGVTY